MIRLHSLNVYTGQDIPFRNKYRIYQPKLSDLSDFTETELFKTINFICIKDQKDISSLVIFLSLFFSDFLPLEERINIIKLLEMIFKNHLIYLVQKEKVILLKKDEQDLEPLVFTPEIFCELQEIFKEMFAYDKIFGGDKKDDFNPINKKAQEIAEKLRKRHQTLAKIKSKENENKSLLGNYLTITSIALGENLTDLSSKITVFQLLKEVERLGMRENFNQLLRIKTSFVTASSSKEPLEDWMKLI